MATRSADSPASASSLSDASSRDPNSRSSVTLTTFTHHRQASTPNSVSNPNSSRNISSVASTSPQLSPGGNMSDGFVDSAKGSASYSGYPVKKEKEQRVPLACLRCRSKRARCSGVRPRCKACEAADADCQWPEGRRRKRTRREMEEAERQEREAAVAAAALEFEHGNSTASAQAHSMRPQHSQRFLPDSHPQPPLPDVYHSDPHRLQHTQWDYDGGALNQPHPPLHLPSQSKQEWDFPGPPMQPPYVWPPLQHRDQPSSASGASVGLSPCGDTGSLKSVDIVNGYATDMSAGMNGMPINGNNDEVLRALQTQTAFVEGDPSSDEDLELYYYRFSGSTAIHPGINRISLKLQSRPRSGMVGTATAPVPSDQRVLPAPRRPEELFDQNNMPLETVYRPLLDTFFSTMSQHFPSISRRRMYERLATGTMSAFMMNCLCAVGARFHPSAHGKTAEACAPFITKAQELLVPLLHLPAHDIVTGLLVLAWASYGQNSEAALWQYSGMAFRMSFDMGLHEISEIYESSAHVVRTRLLFWSLFITDRIISFSTGRPNSIPEEAIEIPLPSDEDFFPDPARNTDPKAAHEPVEPVPFQYLVRAMVLCGRIATALNGRRGRPRTLIGPIEAGPHVLSGLQTQLVQFYASLPDSMKWSVDNFKHQEQRGHGGTFLTLHLWTNAVLALVYHPELTVSPSGSNLPFTASMQRSMQLSLSSSRNISECLVFADLFSSQAYLGSPFAVQPIYVACLAFIHEMKRNLPIPHPISSPNAQSPDQEQPGTADAFMTSLARQNLMVLTNAIKRMEQYWAGIAYVSSVLKERAMGLGLERFGSESKSVKTFISLPDKGLLRRYMGNDLPHNTAPATETSLRTSIAKEQEAAARESPFSVEDLLSSYSIEGLLVSPVNNYELERLIASGSSGSMSVSAGSGMYADGMSAGAEPGSALGLGPGSEVGMRNGHGLVMNMNGQQGMVPNMLK